MEITGFQPLGKNPQKYNPNFGKLEVFRVWPPLRMDSVPNGFRPMAGNLEGPES